MSESPDAFSPLWYETKPVTLPLAMSGAKKGLRYSTRKLDADMNPLPVANETPQRRPDEVSYHHAPIRFTPRLYRPKMTVIPKNVAPLPPPAEQEIDRDILEVSSESAILPRVIKLSSILVAVSNATAVNIREIISPRRSAYIVRARMVYFWIARKYTSRSLPQIGHSCGNRDHSTVMHGINKVERQMDGFAADIAKVKLILQLTDE